jgi:hypothetical protein
MGRDPMPEIGTASPREPCPSGSPSELSLVFMGRRSEVGSHPVTPAEETGEMTMVRRSQQAVWRRRNPSGNAEHLDPFAREP